MSTPYVGEIRLFGFGRTPTGWFACDGSLKSIAENEVLYTLIGTTYGGDGQVTFAVPDLQGRVPIHAGSGPGLGSYVIGQRSGTENVTLSPQQMPAHNHILSATALTATATTPAPGVELGGLNGDSMYVTDTTGATAFAMNPATVGMSGGSQPHNNLMPTLTAQFCIAWAGIFPSQS
ncbi:MAG: phage tail protein [Lysobacter sp.]